MSINAAGELVIHRATIRSTSLTTDGTYDGRLWRVICDCGWTAVARGEGRAYVKAESHVMRQPRRSTGK